jgi:hypothetical protein
MENRTLVDLSATISVRNPLNYDLDAIIINTTMSMEIYPLVTPDFNLSMSMKTLSLQVESVKTFFKQVPLVTPDKIQQTLTAFMEPLKKIINTEFSKSSFKLPLPQILNIAEYTQDPKILVGDGYYMIEADIKDPSVPDDDDD